MYCTWVHDKCPSTISLSPSLAPSTSSLVDDSTEASISLPRLSFYSPSPSVPTISVPTERVTWTCSYTGHVNTCTSFNRYAMAPASACLRAYASVGERHSYRGGTQTRVGEREKESESERKREGWSYVISLPLPMRCTCYRCENVWHDLRLRSLSFGISAISRYRGNMSNYQLLCFPQLNVYYNCI